MISGRDTLTELAGATEEAKRRADDVDMRLAEASERIVELDAKRTERLRALAGTRLGGLASGSIAQRLDEADGKVLAFLDRRRDDLADLESRRTQLDEQIEKLEAARHAAADELERAASAVDHAEAETQGRLAADPTYRARLASAEEAERIAVHADEKASLAEAELANKGKAYRDDPLFNYLWERRFGTPEYRPGGGPLAGLVRWLDGKVAAMVRFDRARADFSRLQELPTRLREHADRVGAAADEAIADVERLEAEARKHDGVQDFDAKVDTAQAKLAAAEDAVEAAAGDRAALEAEIARFAAGEDDGMQDIERFLRSELGREELESLRRDALATPFPEDDAIVAELLDLEDERERWTTTAEELKQASLRNRERLEELRTLQSTFKRERYDAPGSSFPDRDVITMLLAQIVAGSMRGDSLWRVLQRQRRYRPPSSDPTFGSGRFGGGGSWTGGAPSGLPPGRMIDAGRAIGSALGGLAGASKVGKGSFGGTRRTSGRIGKPGRFKTGGRF